VSGIHHITAVTRKVQANVDFYVGFLGLRLVKRTGGFEDAEQLHLIYGDGIGSPGSLITFLVWEDGSPGRVGLGQVAEFSLAIGTGSLGFWVGRALEFGIEAEAPRREFGEPVLRLKDPDGIVVKLVGSAIERAADATETRDIDARDTIQRIRGATLLSNVPEETVSFLERYFGFRRSSASGQTQRLTSTSGDVIDVQNASGFWPAAPGTGVVDHIAFRAADIEDLREVEAQLRRLNSSPTNSHDRKYFHSLYVREPGGTLLELATDGPGMIVDEPVETLGTRVFTPPDAAERTADLAVLLPQFALPGEERVRYLDLPFVHRFHTPDDPDGTTLVLMHGSGGNEADLMPLASRIAPRATLLGVRGRSTEEQIGRWFRRFTTTSFDEADIRFEAEAFAAFLEMATEGYRLDPERLVLVGYSNGANFAAAAMMLHPGMARRALLLRPALVISPPADTDLRGTRVVLVHGSRDTLAEQLPSPKEALIASGAVVDVLEVPADHRLSEADTPTGSKAMALLLQ
jgi:phospholipase/carboxylesterase